MTIRAITFILAAMVAYACAPTKKVAQTPTAVGTWDYVVKNTPEGDLSGVLVISHNGDAYAGYMQNSQGQVDLRNITIVDDQLKCDFDFMGYMILMTGVFADDNFEGKVSVDYNDFPVTAKKRP